MNYTGTLRYDADTGTVIVELRSELGCTIHLTGKRAPGGYDLEGKSGPMPEWLQIPGLDFPLG